MENEGITKQELLKRVQKNQIKAAALEKVAKDIREGRLPIIRRKKRK